MSSDSCRDALLDAVERAAKDEEAGYPLLELAQAWALLQPDPEPDEDESIHQVGSTQMLPFGAGADADWYEDKRPIGFTPR